MVRERGRADGLPSLLADEVPFPVGDDPDAAARHVAYEIGAVVAAATGGRLIHLVPVGGGTYAVLLLGECGHLTWPHFGRCSSPILAPVGW